MVTSMENLSDHQQHASVRITLIWSALGVNLLVLAVVVLEGMDITNIFNFKSACTGVAGMICGWTFSLFPMLAAWMVQSPRIAAWHNIAVVLYILIALIEAFCALVGVMFCNVNLASFG